MRTSVISGRVRNLLASAKEPIAVVAPVDYNGILFARALHRKGVKVLGVFQDARGPFYYTNSCEKVICGDLAGPGLFDVLCELGGLAKTKPVLVPIGDLQVLLVSEHRALLSQHFIFNVPSQDTIMVLMDKVALYAWGRDRFPFPKTCAVRSESDILDALENMTFPVVLKPKYRSEAWLKCFLPKAVLCYNSEQVRSTYAASKAFEEAFLLSEFVPGGDDRVFESHVYYSKGRLLTMYVDRKIRQFPPLLGTGCFCVSEKDSRVAELTIAMLDQFHYSGIGGFEFKRDDRSGEYFVIEPTCGRPSSHCYTGLGEGVNLPYVVYCDLAGIDVPNYTQSQKKMGYINEEADLYSAFHYIRRRELSLPGYLRSLLTVRVCVHLSWRDPFVALGLLSSILHRTARFCIKRISRLVTGRPQRKHV